MILDEVEITPDDKKMVIHSLRIKAGVNNNERMEENIPDSDEDDKEIQITD